MDRVFSSQERPFTEIRFAAIALTAVTADQRHIGILHQDPESKEVRLLHLAWHHDLRHSQPKPNYLWVDPAISPLRLRQVAALYRKVWRSNHKAIPYAFSPPNDCFDSRTGQFLFSPTRHGLTCTSFVLAVFHAAGIQLADYTSWPMGRDEDRAWQVWVVGQLENSDPPAPTDHIQAVKQEIGAVRFRPEEVAGAATVSPLPATFALASERAEQIVPQLP
jgi:hypothetical protein